MKYKWADLFPDDQRAVRRKHDSLTDDHLAKFLWEDTTDGWVGTMEEPPIPVFQGFASQVLNIVTSRGSTYGTPSENHQTTADLWSAWLTRKFKTQTTLTAEDVCLLNILQKVSRLASKTKDDSLLDIAGYVENIGMLKTEQRNK